MDIHPIAKIIVNRGVAEFDASMFSEEQKKDIFGQAAKLFFRQGRFEEGLICQEKAGLPLPIERLKQVADKKMLMGKYKEAYALLAKVGDDKMAEFVQKNFLED